MKETGLSIRLTAGGWSLDARTAAAPSAATGSPRVLTTGARAAPTFSPAIVLCWDAFLPAAARDAMYEHVCGDGASYAPSKVYGADIEGRIDEAHRKSMIALDDPWIRERILPALDGPVRAARRFYRIDDVPLERAEIQVTASGAGDFFATHCDDGSARHYARMLTFVYYLHRHPRAFTGGDLAVFDSQLEGGVFRPASSRITIEPVDNRLIVFPSDRYHAVGLIEGDTPTIGDRRITVNGWFWAKDGFLPLPREAAPAG